MSYKFRDFVKHPKTKESSSTEGRIAVLAIHAGTEDGTGQVVKDVKNASKYIAHNPNKRIASTRVTPTHSEHLSRVRDYADTAVSIHGHGRQGKYLRGNEVVDRTKTVYVTGQNQYLSKKIASQLERKLGKEYTVETNLKYIPKHLQGEGDSNIANRFRNKGVQIELPKKLRENSKHRKHVSDSISYAIDKTSAEYKKAEYKQAA